MGYIKYKIYKNTNGTLGMQNKYYARAYHDQTITLEDLAEAWKPYMKNLDILYTDATCYESAMRYPTDARLLWKCIEKVYPTMCQESRELGIV